MKTRIYKIQEQDGSISMAEAGTASQALRVITQKAFVVKPASAKEVADYLGQGGKISQMQIPARIPTGKGEDRGDISSEKPVEIKI